MKKKLIPFRLLDDDIQKLKAKVVIDKTNMQKVVEVLTKMYLEDNPEIMKRVKAIAKDKHARKRRYNTFDELELDALYRKIEEVSPLENMEKILEELDKK